MSAGGVEAGIPDRHFPKQFSIHRDLRPPFTGWAQQQLGAWRVHTAPDVPVTRFTQAAQTVGFALGWFAHEGAVYHHSSEFALKPGQRLEDLYREFCGRFVILRAIPDGISVTTDPGGLYPVLWDAQSGVLASTPAVAQRHRSLEKDPQLAELARRADGAIWYPFGLTPFRDIERLLPGRCYRVGNGGISPGQRQARHAASSSDAVQEIVRRVCAYATALAAAGKISAHLTAGCDSRMVLAACVAAGLHPRFFTIQGFDRGSRLDAAVAGRLAALAGVEHRAVAFAPPAAQELEQWYLRTGDCIRDAVSQLCRTVREIDDGSFVLTGTAGEVARGFYWQTADLARRGFSPEELVARLGFSPSRGLLERAASWLDDVGRQAATTEILDRAYIDQRLGCWAGPAVFGHDIPRPTLSPFNSQATYDAMLSLPVQRRRDDGFVREFIRASSPELLSVPFNRPVGWSRIPFWRESLRGLIPRRAKPLLKRWLRRLRVR